MEKKIYNKPEVLVVKVDCDIVMQTQSDNVGSPGAGSPTGESPVDTTQSTFYMNPFKWFK